MGMILGVVIYLHRRGVGPAVRRLVGGDRTSDRLESAGGCWTLPDWKPNIFYRPEYMEDHVSGPGPGTGIETGNGVQHASRGETTMDDNDDDSAAMNFRIAALGGFGFSSRMIARALTFGAQVLLTKSLGSAGYGLYQVGKSVVNLCGVFARLGLNKGVVRYGSMARSESDPQRLSGMLTTALVVAGGLGTATALIIYVAAERLATRVFGLPTLTPVFRLFAVALPFAVLLRIGGAALQAFERVDYQEATKSLAKPVLNLLGIAVVLFLGYMLAGVIVAFVLSTVASTVLAIIALWRVLRINDVTVRPSFTHGRELVTFSLPLAIVGASYFLSIRTDRVMLGILGDPSGVGLYSAAALLATQFGLLHTSLVAIFEPIISDALTQGDHREVDRLYRMVKRWSASGTFLFVVPVVLFPELLLSIFGDEFVRSWHVILVLAVPYLFGSVVGPTGALLQMSGNQNLELGNAVAMIGMNVAFNYVFILEFGLIGAAFGTGLAHVLFNTLQIVELKILFNLRFFDRTHLLLVTVIVLLFATSLAASLYLTLLPKAATLLLVGLVYLTFLYLTRQNEDQELVGELLHRLGR